MKKRVLKFPNSDIPLETQIHMREMAAMEAMIGHDTEEPWDDSWYSDPNDPKDDDEK